MYIWSWWHGCTWGILVHQKSPLLLVGALSVRRSPGVKQRRSPWRRRSVWHKFKSGFTWHWPQLSHNPLSPDLSPQSEIPKHLTLSYCEKNLFAMVWNFKMKKNPFTWVETSKQRNWEDLQQRKVAKVFCDSYSNVNFVKACHLHFVWYPVSACKVWDINMINNSCNMVICKAKHRIKWCFAR